MGGSRTTIYKNIDDGEFLRNLDKKIDTTERLRVFGNPLISESTGQHDKSVQTTPVNTWSARENVPL